MATRPAGAATGGAAMKKSGRETTKLRGRNALPVAQHRGPAAVDLQKQLDQRTRELAEAQKHLAEALEQQTATSEVLGVISRSPGELKPVFEIILANATRLCDAKLGLLNLYDGDKFRTVALYNVPSAYADTHWIETFRPPPGRGHAEVLRTKQVVHFDDLRSTAP